MEFDKNEEIKDSMMMESLDETARAFMAERKTSVKNTRPTMSDEGSSGFGGFIIDIPTLKKLLNRTSCEFILSLIQGTGVAPGAQAIAEKSEKDSQAQTQKTTLVTLALKTLASYDFTEFSDSVTQFIENSVLNYLDDENPTVRKDAVKTCCSLSFS